MNKSPVDKESVKSMSCEDIFSNIISRQIKALMFHEQLSEIFDFIGLGGFKKLHQHQYIDESKMMLKISHHYTKTHCKIIPTQQVGAVDEIPHDWYKANKDNVTPAIISQYVNKEFSDYIAWEKETVEHLSEYAKRLFELSEIDDFEFVSCIISDVKQELNKASKLFYKLKATGFSVEYIIDIQKHIHDKYKDRI